MKAGYLRNRLSTVNIIESGAQLFHDLRWCEGNVVCPYCKSENIKYKAGFSYRCRGCGNRFSDKTRTLMHNSKLPVSYWLFGMNELLKDNFIASTRLAQKLRINQKSAWLMLMKLRYSFRQYEYPLSGIIAEDEVYLGGCLKNYHYGRKLRLLRENLLLDDNEKKYSLSAIMNLNKLLKYPVLGMNDGEHIVLRVMPNPIMKEDIEGVWREVVKEGSTLVSDESKLYEGWNGRRFVNNHSKNQYKTSEGYSSNKVENTFSWLSRGYLRFVHCKHKYLQFYLNEFVYRYNTRGSPDIERFKPLLSTSVSLNHLKSIASPPKPRYKDRLDEKKAMFKQVIRSGLVKAIYWDGMTITKDNIHKL